MKLIEIITDDVEAFKSAFHSFMSSPARNQWLAGGDTIQMYVRKGAHLIGKEIVKTLDIANINIDEMERGKGTGTSLINWLHDQNSFSATYVESILNPRLYKHLKSMEWVDVPNSQPPSVYKRTT